MINVAICNEWTKFYWIKITFILLNDYKNNSFNCINDWSENITEFHMFIIVLNLVHVR